MENNKTTHSQAENQTKITAAHGNPHHTIDWFRMMNMIESHISDLGDDGRFE